MFNIGDIVIYGTVGICEIRDITEKKFEKEIIEYYELSPLTKKEEVVYAPKNNEAVMKRMRPILSREHAQEIIDSLPAASGSWIENDRERQRVFKETLLYGSSEDILIMTRTLYLHQIEQYEKGKKLHAQDERVLKDAEKMVVDELSYVFDITPQQVLPMITGHHA